MNADLSVAPEIAQLAAPIAAPPRARAASAPRTDGRLAGELTRLAAAPQRWWDLVRFDERDPVRIPLPDAPGAWLLVLPPGTAADCGCRQATALAGEAVETADQDESAGGAARSRPGASARPLRPGRVRVHGRRAPHRVRAAGPGYSVTLHWNG